MITKFIIKRRTGGKPYDARNDATGVKYVSDMNYSAGELTFDLIDAKNVNSGDVVLFDWDKHKMFKGYIFKYDLKQDGTCSVTAYDGLRYFKSSDSMVFPVSTLGQRFKKICSYLDLSNKVISAPSHKLKAELSDNKSYFSMLQSGIDSTRRAGDGHYFLKDNYGTIELRKYPHLKLKMLLGDNQLVTSYTLSRSIDNAANVVKLTKNSTVKGKRKVTTVRGKNGKLRKSTKIPTEKKKSTTTVNGNTIKNWGKLVYVKKVTGKANAAQIKQQAENLLKEKNKQTNDLKLSAVGNIYLQAGNSVTVKIDKLKKSGIGTKKYLIKKSTHNFSDNYTVDLEMRV